MATIKQQKAVKNIIKGETSVSKAMRDAGYSPNTAISPKKLTDSKGYKELMEQHLLSLEEAFREHNKNIKQDRDKGAKNKALDMLYKLRKVYPSEAGVMDDGDVQITIHKS